MPKYKNNLTLETNLSQPFTEDLARKFVTSPLLWEQLYHGLLRFYKLDEKAFKKSDEMQEGEAYFAVQPELEGKDYTTFRVDSIKLGPEIYSVTSKAVNKSAKFGYEEFKLTMQTNLKEPSVTIVLDYTLKKESIAQLIKPFYNLLLYRSQKLAENPEVTLKDLALVASLDREILIRTQFKEAPIGVKTALLVNQTPSVIMEQLSKYNFLHTLFSKKLTEESKLNLIENPDSTILNEYAFKMNFENVNYKLDKITESIEFKVDLSQENTIRISSTDKISNFHNLLYQIKLVEDNDDTLIEISVNGNRSNLLSFTRGIKSMSRFFTDSVPNTDLMLLLKLSGMLQTAVTHLQHYMHEMLSVNLEPLKPTVDEDAQEERFVF